MNYRGFTLIELLVVVIIIGTLTSIALPQYRKAMDRAKAAEALQLLPAIFEARERWMIENGCQWNGGNAECPDGVSEPTFPKLDIEMKYKDIDTDDYQSIETANFRYYLKSSSGVDQPCVEADSTWGNNRDIGGSVLIYYRGDKFSCYDGEKGGCARLNIDEGTGGCD